jgi:CRP-like cAMP-binding protein
MKSQFAVDGAIAEYDASAGEEHNRLLHGLPAEEIGILEPLLEPFEIRSKGLMYEAGTVIEDIHFPQTGVISLVTVLDGGGGVEALTVGKDGATGIAVLHGIRTTFCRIVGQIPGISRKARVAPFLEALDDMPVLRRRLELYSQFAFEMASQSAACNRMHVTEERCSRWLLMSQDRVGRDEFNLTQGFLSQMLGVRRPGVTVAIGVLEKAGLIAHERGLIRILDRAGLEAAACECYALTKRREASIFGGV